MARGQSHKNTLHLPEDAAFLPDIKSLPLDFCKRGWMTKYCTPII